MKKLVLLCLGVVGCLPSPLNYHYTIENSNNHKEVIKINVDYSLPEKRIHTLLDTMRLISDNQFDNLWSIGFYYENNGCGYSGSHYKILTNMNFSSTETDPKKLHYYTDFVQANKGVLYFKQEEGSDKFYFMKMEENRDTQAFEYMYRAMVNTKNIKWATTGSQRAGGKTTPNLLK